SSLPSPHQFVCSKTLARGLLTPIRPSLRFTLSLTTPGSRPGRSPGQTTSLRATKFGRDKSAGMKASWRVTGIRVHIFLFHALGVYIRRPPHFGSASDERAIHHVDGRRKVQ
ncbi:hypothetical protein LY78DRAFT_709774, partial [Colletotrichum sublineola]